MKINTMLGATATGLAACLTVVPFANAQEGPAPRGAFNILRHDANKDGQLTLDEFTSALQTQFAMQDTDGNGVVTSEERKTAMKARREAAKAARFAALDSDGDGKISETEFSEHTGKGGPPRPGMNHPGPRAEMMHGRRALQTDVSFADFSEPRLAHFATVDADSNKIITQEELHAAASARRPAPR